MLRETAQRELQTIIHRLAVIMCSTRILFALCLATGGGVRRARRRRKFGTGAVAAKRSLPQCRRGARARAASFPPLRRARWLAVDRNARRYRLPHRLALRQSRRPARDFRAGAARRRSRRASSCWCSTTSARTRRGAISKCWSTIAAPSPSCSTATATGRVVRVPLPKTTAKDGFLKLSFLYSGAATQDRCIDVRYVGDSLTIRPETAIELDLGAANALDVATTAALMPRDVTIVLPGRRLTPADIATALTVARALAASGRHVVFHHGYDGAAGARQARRAAPLDARHRGHRHRSTRRPA